MTKQAAPQPVSSQPVVVRERIGPSLQRKLAIGTPGDRFEQEADRVADAVMQGGAAEVHYPSAQAVQRACARCEEDEKIRAAPAGTSIATNVDVTQSVGAARGHGVPLGQPTRAFFEPRFGRDFGSVRIHTDARAADLSQSLHARAFTVGSDVFFAAGQYAPESARGRHLIAHELTHVVQQAHAPMPMVMRGPNDDPDDRISFMITVPAGVSTERDFDNYAEVMIFGRVVGLNWNKDAPAAAIDADLPHNIGKKIQFNIHPSTYAKYKSGESSADAALLDKEYKSVPKGDIDAVNAEIDRRYVLGTGNLDKIKSGETAKIAAWNSFKKDVMADKRKLAALPDVIKTFLGGEGTFTPDNYTVLSALADQLTTMSAADLEDYKSKTNKETTDLYDLLDSVNRYLKEKAQRDKEREASEAIATRLYGAEDVYEEYKRLGQTWAKLNKEARDAETRGDGAKAQELRAQASKSLEQEKAHLTKRVQELGFVDVPDFIKTLDAYEQAFLKETAAIAFDVLAKYDHVLFEAEQTYSKDSEVDALLGAVAVSGAPELVAQATERIKEAQDLANSGSFQTVQGAGDQGNKVHDQAGAKMNEAADLMKQAREAVGKIEGFPLLHDPKFPRKDLLGDRATAKSAILGYVRGRRDDVKESRENITNDPKLVYKLDKLMAIAYARQDIAPDSIYDKVISDRRKSYIADEKFAEIVLTIVGLALTLVTFGGGAIAVVAGIGAFGISAYQAVESFRNYEVQSAAYGAGLLSDDPSFAWVIVSVVGAFADLGAAVAAVKALKLSGAVATFEAGGDLVKFEKELQTVKELNEAARANLVRAAENWLASRRAMREMLASTGQLNAAIIPGLQQAGHLTIAATYSIREGVGTFRAWLAELEAEKVIASAKSLKPEEIQALRTAWNEGLDYAKNIPKNVPDLEKAIAEFRAETGIKRTINAEGKVQGGTTGAAKAEIEGVDKSLFREGSTKSKGSSARTVNNNPRYQSPQSFGGTKNHAEQNLLGDIADEIDTAKGYDAALKGKPKPDVKGSIQLHIEQEVCAACRQGLANPDALPGVVQQFSKEYPNVTLVITNARTNEVIFVRGGDVVKF